MVQNRSPWRMWSTYGAMQSWELYARNDDEDFRGKPAWYHCTPCWFRVNTRSRLRDVTCRLLQCNPRRRSEDNNRQATMSVKRCCTSRQWHQEVWPGTVTTDAPGVTLAGHSRASEVQTGHAYPPVSARQGASVSVKLLHSSRQIRYTTASMLRCTSSVDCTSTSSGPVRSAGICCRWSDNVQRSARWSTRSPSQHNNIWTIDEDTPLLCLSARLAH